MTSMPTSALLEPRVPRAALHGAGWAGSTRYRLAPGVELIPQGKGGTLLSQHPLTVTRLNAVGFALLSSLSTTECRSLDELTARFSGLSPLPAAALLERLAGKRLLLREPAPPPAWPSVSIIVAAHGRPISTRACIRSLLALDYPGAEIEILVVDDASDPPLAPALADLPVRVMRLDRNLGQSAARNLAAIEAAGELLAFIDNDCEARSDWLRNLVPHFADAAVAVVGGRVVGLPSHGRVAAYEAVRSPLDMGVADGPVGPREAVAYLPSCNLIVRRDALLAVGGFATEMRVGEDVDFSWRLMKRGSRIHYAASGEVGHDHRVQLRALLARRADYGVSEADLQARHPETGSILNLPRTSLLALAALTALGFSLLLAAAFAFTAVALVASEVITKRGRLRGIGLSLPADRLVACVAREHAASLYHLGHHATRYYGLPLLAVSLLWPPLLPATGLLLALPPVWDHLRLRPAVALPTFVVLSWLEMAAYQTGVWRGCFARPCWRPLLPRIRWRP